MKCRGLLLTFTTILFLYTGCSHVNTAKDYYYKENINLNGINVEFYGNGYGTYGQLLPEYCTGSIDTIFNPESSITITTSTADNNLPTANEIYINLNYNSPAYVNNLVTLFSTENKKQISSFRIYYKDQENKETTVGSSYYEDKTYTINNTVTSICFYIRLNKYYSSSYEIEALRDTLSYTPFTIRQFMPE